MRLGSRRDQARIKRILSPPGGIGLVLELRVRARDLRYRDLKVRVRFSDLRGEVRVRGPRVRVSSFGRTEV